MKTVDKFRRKMWKNGPPIFAIIGFFVPLITFAGWFGVDTKTLPVSWYPGDGNVRFIDLTGKTYSGSDADLIGIQLTHMGIDCMGNASYLGGPPIVSWQDESVRFPKAYMEGKIFFANGPPLTRIKHYSIHFRVLDRKGGIIHEQDFEYHQNEYKFHEGDVYRGRDPSCQRDLVKFNKSLNLAYTTIEFWIKSVEWNTRPEGESHSQPDQMAFPVPVTH